MEDKMETSRRICVYIETEEEKREARNLLEKSPEMFVTYMTMEWTDELKKGKREILEKINSPVYKTMFLRRWRNALFLEDSNVKEIYY